MNRINLCWRACVAASMCWLYVGDFGAHASFLAAAMVITAVEAK